MSLQRVVKQGETRYFCQHRMEVIPDKTQQKGRMLLNEFLKEHSKVTKLESTVAHQQKQIEALNAGLQKVSAQLELGKPKPQMVLNDQ